MSEIEYTAQGQLQHYIICTKGRYTASKVSPIIMIVSQPTVAEYRYSPQKHMRHVTYHSDVHLCGTKLQRAPHNISHGVQEEQTGRVGQHQDAALLDGGQRTSGFAALRARIVT
jgi:hypothetical protein